MSRHTAGPWYISGKTVYALNGQGFNRFSALVQDAHTGDEELEANTRLIASAPDLLEALSTLLNMDVKGHRLGDRLQFSTPGREILDKCNSAIAKALGEDQ